MRVLVTGGNGFLGSSVVAGLAGLGGTVQKRDDDISYLRAEVPIGKAEPTARLTSSFTCCGRSA